MEDRDTLKIRKDKIKNIAIIFLTIMLVLTFFSNSIMNFSLPEVATQTVQSGSITEKVRGTGNVTANDPYKVVVKESRVIESVNVKKGDEVEKDQVLFYLEDKDSDELEKAEAELEALNFAFAQKILSGDISAGAFANAQGGTDFTISQYQARIQAVNDKVTAAQTKVDTLTNSVNAIQKQLDITGNKVVDTTSEQNAVIEAQLKVDKASNRNTTASDKYSKIKGTMDSLGSKEDAEKDIENLKLKMDAAEILYNQAQADSDSNPEDEDLKDAAVVKKDAYNTAKEKYDNACKVRDSIITYGPQLTNAEQEATAAAAALQVAKDSLASAQAALDKVKNTTSDTVDKADLSKQLTEAKANLTSATAALETAKTEQAAAVKDVQTELDVGNQNTLIAEKQKEVEKLREDSVGATIKSPVAGTVTEITKTAGETTVPEEALATIQVAGKGFTVSFSVTNEQAKKVKTGDVAELQNAWYYEDVKATLSKIQADTQDPGQKKLLVFNVEGSIQDGESLSLSVGQRSADYDMIVPNSAIREDKNGKFILIIEEKTTPFGNRYKAKKVEVEVLASDDKQTAINATLEGYEYVITTSNKPVEPGKQVRLSDN